MYNRAARRAAWGGNSSKKKPEEMQEPSGEKDSQNKSRPHRGTSPPARPSQNKQPGSRNASPRPELRLPGPDYNYAVHDDDEEDTKIKTKMVEIEKNLDKHQERYDRKLESYAVASRVGNGGRPLPGLTGRHIDDLHNLSKAKLKEKAKDWAEKIENVLKNNIIEDMKQLRECYEGLKNKEHIPLLSDWKRYASDEAKSCVKEKENLKALAEKLVNIPEGDEHTKERNEVLKKQQESFIKLATHEYDASVCRRQLRYVKGDSDTYEIPVHKFFTPKKV